MHENPCAKLAPPKVPLGSPRGGVRDGRSTMVPPWPHRAKDAEFGGSEAANRLRMVDLGGGGGQPGVRSRAGGAGGGGAVRRGRCALPHVPPQLMQVSP
jgi:hypothetical protein